MNEIYSALRNRNDLVNKSGAYSVLPIRRRFDCTRMMAFVYLFLLSFLGSWNTTAQTLLINPATDGGFESGATFAANGWTVANSASNPWVIGALSNGAITGNAAFISDNGTTPNYSTSGTCSNYFWRDVTVPAGETKIKLDFNWASQGETNWDIWQVFVAPTSVVPVSGTHPGTGAALVPVAIAGAVHVANGIPQTGVQSLSLYLPTTLAGTTFRLIFHWKSDTSLGTQPPASIDNISLVSGAPGNFVSVASGAWSSNATWNLGSVPGPLDNATVAAGMTVNVDANGQSANNVVVNGVLSYTTTPTAFAVLGNLTVSATGEVNVFSGTVGKTLTVAGNVTNNGMIDVSVGTAATGNLTLNGSEVQTVSGSGTFVSDVIRNLTFSNTNTATPNVNWLVNNVKIANNLNMTGARVNLASNKMTFGNNAAGGSLTAPSGTGFLSGGKFARWWTAAATGSLITAGTDPTNTTSRYPFINAAGFNRAMYISRTNATDAVAGELAVVYNDAATITTGLAIADGAYSITDRYNGNWVVSTEGTPVFANSYRIVVLAQNAMAPLNGNARILNAGAALGGLHQNGSTTPGAQRIDVTQASLLAGPLYLGINAADVPFTSIASGPWNAAATWNKGVVPSCTDVVTIAAGTTVTSSSAGNTSKGIVVTNGGTLIVASGGLTVGCTLNNSSLVNNGTLTVMGGSLNINGNLLNNAGGTFNQSGGLITVDGNDNGIVANSVPKLTSIVKITASGVANLNLTAGTLVVVDPHADTSTSDYAFVVSQGGAANAAGATHTLQFGNGVSTTAGGHANGLNYYLYQGSYYYTLGNVTADVLTGVNRFVKTLSTVGILGNLTVTSGEYQLASNHVIAGNLVNNGTLTAGSLLALGTFVPPSNILPAANAQSVSGSGIFRNLPTDPTANLTNFQVSNTSTTGVTLNVPLAVSGTLTMNDGFINTTNANLLSLGTPTTAGILSGTPSATAMIKGPFARTIINGNTAFVLFPVGKSDFAPISLAPSTTAVSVLKAEAFDTNTGTASAAISNLSANRRWTTGLVSGSFSDIKVRLGDALIGETSVPVQAPTAAGVYTSSFGSIATYTAGTPNQIESPEAISASNFTGFLSFAQANACSGTPAPGATLASSTTICLGESVALSLQNLVAGTGVTFQWKSATDGVNYTDIADATSATLTVVPTATTQYICAVTCATGSVTGTSTPVQVTFSNSIATTTPGARCGVGSVNLMATPSAGATVSWYESVIGGVPLGSGATFATPIIENTTTFYATASSTTTGMATVGTGTALTTSSSQVGIFCNYWSNGWKQIVYTAEDLNASGLSAGLITSLTFNIATLPGPTTVNNFSVRMGSTAATTLTTFQTTGLAVAFGPVNYNPTVGLNTLTLTAPYNWDGVSNILIDIREDGQYGSGNSTTFYSTTPTNTVVSAFNSSSTLNPGYYTTNPVPAGANTRPNITFNGQVACASARVPVVATVSSPPVLALSTDALAVCQEATSSAVTVTSNAADFDSYVWEPAAGVSGDAATGWFFSPTTATTYTLTASQTTGSLCAATATVDVTVNPIPSAITFTPTAPAVCVDGILPLSIDGGTLGAAGKIGMGTATNTVSTPYKGYWGGAKTQSLYTAAELTALGMQAGQKISSIGFVALTGTPNVLTNFTIQAGFVANATITGGFLTGASNVVLAPSIYTAPTGVGNLDYALATPLLWDGTSNLLVETCFNNNNSGGTSPNSISVESSTVASGLHVYYSGDNNPDACSTATSTGSTTRPNLRVTAMALTSVVWSPAVNLFTDAAATVPYVADVSTATVYFKSNAAGSTTYTVTASTDLTCSISNTVAVVVNALPNLVVNNTAILCNGGTADLMAGTVTLGSDAGLTFAYFTDAAATLPVADPMMVGAGTYYIKATNASGCTAMGTVVVTEPSVLVASISDETNVLCNGALTGDATAVGTGGTAPYTFTWSTGATTASLSGVGAGTYTVSVTDASGCEATAAVTLTEPTVLVASISDQTNVICNGALTGGATAAATGGATPYSYSWNTGATTAVLSGVGAGVYTVTITDTNGCSSTASVTLTESAALVTSISMPTVVSCNGAANGVLMAEVTGGAAPYSYSWNTGATTATLSDVGAGVYTVVVTDDNGCSEAVTITVAEPEVLLASISNQTDLTCTNAFGSATVAGSGGTAPYTYAWSNGQTTAVLSGVGAGAYTVTLTDAKGCTATASVIFTEGTGIVFVVNDPAATCGDLVDLTAAAVTAGSEMGLTFEYFTDAAATVSMTNASSVGTTGTYYMKATSAAGCTSILAVSVVVNTIDAPTGAALQDFTTGQTLADFTVTTAASGTVTWYTAASGGAVLPSNTVLVSGTTYYASQTVSGCESTTRLAVTAGADLAAPSFEINNLRYYPNPVLDVLNVTYAEAIQGVQLYNMLGQLVYNRSTSSTLVQIDMTSLATGTYVLQVTVKGIVKTVKMIKK